MIAKGFAPFPGVKSFVIMETFRFLTAGPARSITAC